MREGGEIIDFQPIGRRILQTCKIGSVLLLAAIVLKSHKRFQLPPKSTTLDDLERPYHSQLHMMRHSESPRKFERRVTHTIISKNVAHKLLSSNIRFTWGFRGDRASNDSGVVMQKGDF